MRTGKVRPLVMIDPLLPLFEMCGDITLAGGESSADFTPLAGDTAGVYLIEAELRSSTATSSLYIRLNDAVTGYGKQLGYYENTTLYSERGATNFIYAGEKYDKKLSAVILAKSGLQRGTITNCGSHSVGDVAMNNIMLGGHVWNNTANELTKISVYPYAGTWTAGDRIRLYRMVA